MCRIFCFETLRWVLRRGVAFGIALALAACTLDAKVTPKHPVFTGPVGGGALVDAEKCISLAIGPDHHHPLRALGDCLEALQIASEELQRHPDSTLARRDYDFALSRALGILCHEKLDLWTKPLVVPGPHGEYVLTYRPDPRPEWNPILYDFTPTDEFDIRGEYVKQRTMREGVGAPIVAVERQARKNARRDFAPSRLYYSVTMVAQFDGRRCILSAHDPLAEETVSFRGRTLPLAADFTAPLAVMLQETDPAKYALARVFDPEKYAHTATIERLQPYDSNKTMVLVVHGLMDSQATWVPMINTLRGDPVIPKHYQFWFYSYPSGYPYPYSAAILRHKLDEVEQRFPGRKPLVVIGHSMGGCITRLLLTDSGDELALKIFGKPLEQVPLSPHTRTYFEDELHFHHRPEIGRAILIAAPLRGSDLAAGWVARIVTAFIRPLKIASEASREMLHLTAIREEELKPKRRANSVDTLSPKSRFVNALNTIPICPGVPCHTIIGDRGRGDSPNSSDGVVPYWSSHLPAATTECIVPCDHSAHQDPRTIAEVLKILKAHAE